MTRVEAVFLERELVRVEFAGSHLVSDHPTHMGGEAKGPSPGVILLAGMTAASIFSARQSARRLGVRVGSIVARSGMRADREGVAGPLGALAFLGRFSRRLELGSSEPQAVLQQLAGPVGYVETLRRGVALEERVDIIASKQRAQSPLWTNARFFENEQEVDGLAPGATITGPAPTGWRVSATDLEEGLVLVDFGGAALLVSQNGEAGAPTPHELLLGALASCTAIYIGRNALHHRIPVERITVTVEADAPADFAEPVSRMSKTSRVEGTLTDEEAAKCKFFGDFCALGETLKRGAEIVGDVVAVDSPLGPSGLPLRALVETAPPPAAFECDDQSCCLPEPSPAALRPVD